MTTNPRDPSSASEILAVATVQIDDDRFRVTEWRFAPGAHTGWHRHEMDYTVVPMTTGSLRIRSRDGETTAELVTGRAYSRVRGAEHDLTNPGASEFVFVEVEVKPQVKAS